MHAHYATYPALAAWLCRRLTGTRYSFTAHAHDLYVDQSMLARKLADAEFAVTISEHNRRFLEAYGDGSRIHVVHAGIATAVLSFRPRGVPAEGPVRALCVASLQEYKGHAVLLEALAAPELDRVELDVVGDGPLRAELEARAGALGLGGRCDSTGACARTRCASSSIAPTCSCSPALSRGTVRWRACRLSSWRRSPRACRWWPRGCPAFRSWCTTGRRASSWLRATPSELREALVRVMTGGFEPDLDAGRQTVEREFDVADTAARLRELIAAAHRRDLEQTSSTPATTP